MIPTPTSCSVSDRTGYNVSGGHNHVTGFEKKVYATIQILNTIYNDGSVVN